MTLSSEPEHYTRLLALTATHGVTAAIVTPRVPMPTVITAAAAIGVAPAQILKSLLFMSATAEAVLAVAAGTDRVDRRRLAQAAGVPKLTMATPPVVLARTGYPVGGVAPIGHLTPIRVIIDTAVMALPLAYGGAGDDAGLLAIAPADILRLTGALIADIVDPPPAASSRRRPSTGQSSHDRRWWAIIGRPQRRLAPGLD